MPRELTALHCGDTPHCRYQPCVCLCQGCWIARITAGVLADRPKLREPEIAAGRCARVSETLIHQYRAKGIQADLLIYWKEGVKAGEVHIPHDLYWNGPLPAKIHRSHHYLNHCITVVDRGDHLLHIDLTARQFNEAAPCPLLWTQPKIPWRRFRVGGGPTGSGPAPWYGVTDTGVVYSMRPCGRPPLPLKVEYHYRTGHPRVRLYIPRGSPPKPKHHSIAVHKLVAEAWLGPPPEPGLLVRHQDNDPTNNHVSNLAWGDHTENWWDSHETHVPNDTVYTADPALGF